MIRTFKIVLLFFMLSHTLSGQQKFSIKFKNAGARATHSRQVQLFSISVKDGDLFLRQYGHRVAIQSSHPASGVFHLYTTPEWLLNSLSTDDNVLFIDIVSKPGTESVNASANGAVNRVNMLRRFYPGLKGEGRKISVKRSEEHTSELQSQSNLVCRLLLEKKKKKSIQ